MAKRTKRIARSEYVRGSQALPPPLKFLNGERFVAVIETTENGLMQRTIELKSATLKDLFRTRDSRDRAAEQLGEALARIENLQRDLALCEQELLASKLREESVAHNLEVMKRVVDGLPDAQPTERSPKSHYDRMTEVGTTSYIRSSQGGAPGLGKRK